MNVRLKLLIPAGALMVAALTGCSSNDQAAAPAAPAGNQQQATQTGGAQNGGAAAATQKPKEEPLTGQLKQQAERAALAKYPGTVVKSEHDAERPGTYAVEIQQANGQSIEVYLDKSFKILGTKNEAPGGDGDGD